MNIKFVFNILGRILFVEGLLLLPSLIIALANGEATVFAYVVTIALTTAIGVPCFILKPKNKAIFAREGYLIVGLAWVAVSLFGALPLWISREIPRYIDALFEVVSGFTTTGASVLTQVEGMSLSNLFWRSFTHWVGGMGVLVFVLAILPQSETHSIHLIRAEMPGPVVGKIVAKLRLTARILYGIYFAMTFAEVLLLFFGGMPLFDSLVNSFATAGTGGFSIKNASIGAYGSVYFDVVIGIFMLLFSINFNIFYLILIGNIKSALKSEELHWFLAIITASVLLIAVNILPIYGGFAKSLQYSFFQVSSVISTTGFATADFNLWPDFSRGLLVFLMFLGACAGSTGGGIKIARIAITVKSAANQVRKLIFPRSVTAVRFEGKPLDDEVKTGITSFMYAYFIILSLSTLLLTIDGPDLITDFTAVVACLNNIGPGLGEVGAIGNYSGFSVLSKLVLIFNMLAGRLEIFPMLVIFAPSAWSKR